MGRLLRFLWSVVAWPTVWFTLMVWGIMFIVSGWWWALGLLPPLVVMVIMLRARSPFGIKRATLGAGIAAMSIAALLAMVITPPPASPDWVNAAVLEYDAGDLPLNAGYHDYETLSANTFVIFEDGDDINVELMLDEVVSKGGRVAILDGSATVTCGTQADCIAPEGRYRAINISEADWPSQSIHTDSTREMVIVEFELPLDDSHVHQRFDVRAEATVAYVSVTNETIEETFSRKVTLFVGSSEELPVRQAFNQWRERNEIYASGMASGSVYALVIAIVVGGLMTRHGMRRGRVFSDTGYPIQFAGDVKLKRYEPSSMAYNPPPVGGEVTYVKVSSVWDAAGLYHGDVILQVDEHIIRGQETFRLALERSQDRPHVQLLIWRSGEMFERTVRFNRTPTESAYAYEKSKR